MTAALRFVFRVEPKMDQRVVPLAGFHDDIAALAAIAARGPSTWNKLLPPKSKTAVAAVAGLYANCGFINEHETVVGRWPRVVRQAQFQKTWGRAGRAAILEYIGEDWIEVGTAELCLDS